ncbi:STAS domain-containing protein [Vibrio sp. JPW-9-11-11]|uniref:STAS domain-containing protein n=1 Tax=Vibrio sp. JPW-9-11-11 TaxID=1416532 RepID=UPI0015933047|nr:lipid asymmetry maintenance protein MlaB [Vibrio sp. JPW-9-11-11]NVD08198.1 STAS domain-containing protein [Vibrio sp. JPW-9-11-11]
MDNLQWRLDSELHYSLSGDLDRESVPALWQTLKQQNFSRGAVNVSLEKVVRVDSAGMVMLIHLIEHAKKQNCHIMLSFVPDELHTLFQLSNVEEFVAEHLESTTGVNCG